MKNDEVRFYILSFLLITILFFALFVSNKVNNIELAVIMLVYTIIIKMTFNKSRILSINKKYVTLTMLFFALIYLGIFYLIGLIINSFYMSPTIFGINTLCNFIIPLIIIIISSELIRYIFICQKSKYSKIIAFIPMLLIDLFIYARIYNLNNTNEFMAMIGFVLFASISCNLFYNYISGRFGVNGIIIYRIITVLYPYIIPVIPNIYVYIRSFFRMIYPFLMYLVIENTYSKNSLAVSYVEKKKNNITICIGLVLMILITMLISCKFKYGVLVIGTNSMSGTLEVGDVILFEKYDNKIINKGEIIIFEKDNLKIVHRIVDVKVVNGEIRYYTKGDANKNMDGDYVTVDNIIGIEKTCIRFIGYPTILVNELFS